MGKKLADRGVEKVIAISSGRGAKIGRLARNIRQNWGFMSIISDDYLAQPREAYIVTNFRLAALFGCILKEKKKEIGDVGLEKAAELFERLKQKRGYIEEKSRNMAGKMYGDAKTLAIVTDGRRLSQGIATRVMQQFAECPFIPTIIYTQQEIEKYKQKISLNPDRFVVCTIGEVEVPEEWREVSKGWHNLTEIAARGIFGIEEKDLTILQKICGIDVLMTSFAYNMAVLRGVEPMAIPLIEGDGTESGIPYYRAICDVGSPLYEQMLRDFEAHRERYRRITEITTEDGKPTEELTYHSVVNIVTTEGNLNEAISARDALLRSGKLAYVTLLPEGNHNEICTWLPFFAIGTEAEGIAYVAMVTEEDLEEKKWLQGSIEYFLNPTGRFYLYTLEDRGARTGGSASLGGGQPRLGQRPEEQEVTRALPIIDFDKSVGIFEKILQENEIQLPIGVSSGELLSVLHFADQKGHVPIIALDQGTLVVWANPEANKEDPAQEDINAATRLRLSLIHISEPTRPY